MDNFIDKLPYLNYNITNIIKNKIKHLSPILKKFNISNINDYTKFIHDEYHLSTIINNIKKQSKQSNINQHSYIICDDYSCKKSKIKEKQYRNNELSKKKTKITYQKKYKKFKINYRT